MEMFTMKRYLLLVLVALLFVACAATEPEPALTDLTGDPEGDASALLPVTPDPEENMPTPHNDADQEPTADGGVVKGRTGLAGAVDMGSLTPSAPEPGQTPRVMPAPGVPANLSDIPGFDPLLREMAADLSRREGVPVEQINVKAIQATTWSDGSLGCPQPGMMYTMALVDGYQVSLEANGKTFFYHTSGKDFFVYCADAKPIKGAP
jgi:hypothetical protein